MLKKRLIPVLLLQNGLLVRSEAFRKHQVIGNPLLEVKRFNEWNVDELIYLDITRGTRYDLRRDDQKVSGLADPLSILDAVARTCFMPLTWGGRITTVGEMRERFQRGADKITINSAAFRNQALIREASRTFGSQAIVISIDAVRHPDGGTEVLIDGGRTPTSVTPAAWAGRVEELGAGEILLQSIDRDGTGRGYDLDLIREVVEGTSIPVIACSGVGRYEQYVDGISAGASAVAAANIWHFKELSDKGGKMALKNAGIDVRF
jgi:cyclase